MGDGADDCDKAVAGAPPLTCSSDGATAAGSSTPEAGIGDSVNEVRPRAATLIRWKVLRTRGGVRLALMARAPEVSDEGLKRLSGRDGDVTSVKRVTAEAVHREM